MDSRTHTYCLLYYLFLHLLTVLYYWLAEPVVMQGTQGIKLPALPFIFLTVLYYWLGELVANDHGIIWFIHFPYCPKLLIPCGYLMNATL